MLPLGTIGSRACAFTHNQQVTVMSLWAIMPSPLIFGGMPIKLGTDSWTLALLTNEEVLAVNQDSLGARAKRISQQGTTEVWAKDLSGGRKAVALFNRDTQDATVSVTFAQLGLSGTLTVRDLWHRADATGMTTGISVNVPNEGALMYIVSPPGGTGGTGAGGASGGGGASGSGGASGTSSTGGRTGNGGTSGVPGSGGSGGQTGTGGASANGGGGVVSGSGGSGAGGSGGANAGTGGSSASASGGHTNESGGTGAGGATGMQYGGSTGTGGGTSGCSCAVGGASVRAGKPIGLLLLLGALAWRRRRR
jgi:MYXO-CTERM domain-containing protein